MRTTTQMTVDTVRPGSCTPLQYLILNNTKKRGCSAFFSICLIPLLQKPYKINCVQTKLPAY